jgi:glycopeptide antibiotics resistance protein
MIPRIFHPFLPYRSLFLPILLVSAIVVPCWLAFRLYRARNSGQRLSPSREIVLLIFVAYLAGLAAVTLGPNRPSRTVAEAMVGVDLRPSLASLTCSAASLPRGSADRGFCMRNARGNAVLFFPLGILLPLIWRRLRFWRGLQIALALSIGIELVQVLSRAWGSYRSADVNDVILNCLGASVGLALMSLLRLRQGTRPAVQRA